MKRYVLYLALLLLASTSLRLHAKNQVSFFEEHIDFSLDMSYFIINGIYSFHNETENDVNQQIVFPFADKTVIIDSIRIINLTTGRNIQFKKMENSVLFNFTLSPKDTVDVNIFYRQKISITNKYIITSTQSWGKPLEKAVYTLTTEKNLRIKSFSYLPDSVIDVNDKKLYTWEKHNFLPKYEFEITIDR